MKILNVRLMSLVAVVLLFGLSCSEREINSENLQQRGDELYYAVNEEKPYSGKVVETYENGQKRVERTFKNGKLHGLSTTWDSDGQKNTEISYKDGYKSGHYREWHYNGQQRMEGAYKDGKEDGRWVFWYANGQQEKEGAYKDGKEDGHWGYWYDNGQKQRESTYNDGILDGRWVSWNDKGKQEREGAYKHGKEDGRWVFWYANGQKQKEVTYKDGKLEGGWNFWTIDGRKLDTDVVTDIDGNSYRTIKIGDQWWMAENLRATHYRNGDAITKVAEVSNWGQETTGTFGNYSNDPDNAATYGLLFNCYAVNDRRSIAPEGWHVPTDVEWQTLINHLGGEKPAGEKIKISGTIHWNISNTSATDESGFSVLPGGHRYDGGVYGIMGTTPAYSLLRSYSDSYVYWLYNGKPYSVSVRCVRD